MLFEFKQINATGNGSETIYRILQNPRVENGMNVAEEVGTLADFSNGGRAYRECEPRIFIFGGNWTMTEYDRELLPGEHMTMSR